MRSPVLEGPLSTSEKDFLKCSKKVREILKLNEMKKSGPLDKSQEKKLERREEAFRDFAEALTYLPDGSAFRERNQDLIEFVSPLQQRDIEVATVDLPTE